MNAWFSRLPARRQLLWIGCFVTLAVLAGLALSWQAHARLREARMQLRVSAENLVALEQLVLRYQSLAAARGAGAAESNTVSLTAIVNESLQDRSFQPSRIQQDAGGDLQLRLDNVPFDAVLEWLLELDSSGSVVLRSVAVSQGQGGNASMTLAISGR